MSAFELNPLIFEYRTTRTAETHGLSLFMGVNQTC